MERASRTTLATAAAKLAALRASARDGRAGAGAGAANREPRSAPASLQKNVTIAETCEFYGVQDAVSTCRVPRSCQDCLKMPDCVISSIGKCTSTRGALGANAYKDDYHKQLAAYPQGTGYNVPLSASTPAVVFYAANATYCAASDAVCAKCRGRFREAMRSPKADNNIGSQFCVGSNGCVCVAICEVPELREKYTYDRDCGQSAPTGLPTKPVELQKFTSTHRDPRAPLVNVHQRRSPDNSCAYHAEQDVQGCHRPRTCQECLQQDDCVLSRFKCATMDNYQPSLDFRVSKLDEKSSSQMTWAQFPSSNTSYCPSSDPVCAACRKDFQQLWKKKYEWETLASMSEFCVGENDCVCISACESFQWSTGVRDTECSTLTRKPSNSPIAPLMIAAVVGLLLVALYKGSKDRSSRRDVPPAQQTAEQLWRHMLDEAPAIGRLDLFGWRAFHERLLAKEDELLRGEEPGSPVVAPVSFDFEASAPDFDEDESSAPSAQNPTALASAPTYVHLIGDAPSASNHDPGAPSAPDFDDEGEEETSWISTSVNAETEGRGSVTRRSRRSRQ